MLASRCWQGCFTITNKSSDLCPLLLGLFVCENMWARMIWPSTLQHFFTIHHCVDRDVFKALSLLFIALPLCWQGVVKVTGITLITLRCRVLSSCGSGSSCNRSKHLPIFLCCTPKGTRQIIKQIIMITIMITSSIMKTWSVWTLNWHGSWYTSCGWCQARRVT